MSDVVVGATVRLGGLDKRLHQPDIPINTEQEKLNAERMYGRQLRLNKGYAAANNFQPTYGYFSFDPVVSGRIQEVLFLSIWGTDPFSTTVQTQTPIANSSTSATGNSVLTVTLGGVAGQTTYLSGFEITGSGATAGSTIVATISGLINAATYNYSLTIPAGVTTPLSFSPIEFPQPIPAYQQNQGITLTVPAFGAGNPANGASATIHGYQQTNASSLAGQAIGFISSYQPQDSNAEPPFPNLVLAPSTLPVINAPTRRQVLVFPSERFIICVKGLANGTQLNASISVVEYEMSTFLKGLTP